MSKALYANMVFRLGVILFASALIFACSPLPIPTASSVRATPTDVLITPSLSIKPPDSISVQVDGMGLNGKRNFTLDLKRANNQFTGYVVYAISDWQGFAASEQETVTVPADVVTTFTAILQSTPLDSKPYLPPPTVPDAYGSTHIRIQSEDQAVSFYLGSPLSSRWMISIRDDKAGTAFSRSPFGAESNIPAKSLEILKPYYHPELEQKIIQAQNEQRNRRITPTPKSP
jgi:hypothetical protein